MADSTIFINGRFLTQDVGGVQRFAREIVRAVDQRLQSGRDSGPPQRWVLLVPFGTDCDLNLACIEVKVAGRGSGHFWEQLVLPHFASGGVLINLANSGPVAQRRGLVVIHDAAVYRTPENFGFLYAAWHRLLGLLLARKFKLATVSRFSRDELSRSTRVAASEISVIGNSCEHVLRVLPDDGVLARLGVAVGGYFLLVGSPSPNKNINRAIAAFAALAAVGIKFVVVGAADPAVFGRASDRAVDNVVLAGRLDDAEVVCLYKHAIALVFPSLYEGFGIPPLEAMLHSCPVLASRIPSVIEVCGDAVVMFDPMSISSITASMRQVLDQPEYVAMLVRRGRARAAAFSWDNSAASLNEAAMNICATDRATRTDPRRTTQKAADPCLASPQRRRS